MNYFTMSRDRTDVQIDALLYQPQPMNYYLNKYINFGNVNMVTRVFKYNKVSKTTYNVLDTVQLSLPPIKMFTKALWINIPTKIVEIFSRLNIDIIASMHSVAHLLIGLLPLFIHCSSTQFDTECPHPFDTVKRIPRIIICETIPNGIGLIQEIINKNIIISLMKKGLERIKECKCIKLGNNIDGCPSCVHSTKCHEYNMVSSRKGALLLIQSLLNYNKPNILHSC